MQFHLLSFDGPAFDPARAGQSTARLFEWSEVVQRILLPRVELSVARAMGVAG